MGQSTLGHLLKTLRAVVKELLQSYIYKPCWLTNFNHLHPTDRLRPSHGRLVLADGYFPHLGPVLPGWDLNEVPLLGPMTGHTPRHLLIRVV